MVISATDPRMSCEANGAKDGRVARGEIPCTVALLRDLDATYAWNAGGHRC